MITAFETIDVCEMVKIGLARHWRIVKIIWPKLKQTLHANVSKASKISYPTHTSSHLDDVLPLSVMGLVRIKGVTVRNFWFGISQVVLCRGHCRLDDSKKTIETKIEECNDRAYMVALSILRDPVAAEDAVQEAITRTIKAKERYDNNKPFYPWFYRILKNYCLDVIARRKRRRHVGDPDPVITRTATTQTTDGSLILKQRDEVLHRAIASLSETHREIIHLRHWQDLSYDEIGDVFGIPIGTVMSRLYRARKALQKRLDADPDWSL